jgi:hypothetical protein
MRAWAVAAVLLGVSTQAVALEPVLLPGEELETRLDADFDGNGTADVAYITRTDEGRALRIGYGENGAEYLPLETTPLGPGELSFANGVLVFEDLTGGTTAYATTRRYRFDQANIRMRLIGFDFTLYSRTYAHDGFELSWNLITGRLITRELHLNEKGGDAAYDPIVEKTTIRKSAKVWLFDTPDPETLMEQVRGR